MPTVNESESAGIIRPVALQKPGFLILALGLFAPSFGLWASALACSTFLAPTNSAHYFGYWPAVFALVATICLLITVFSVIEIHRHRTIWLLLPGEVWQLSPSLTEVVSVQREKVGEGVEVRCKAVQGGRMAKLDFHWKRQGRQDCLIVRSSKLPTLLDDRSPRKPTLF